MSSAPNSALRVRPIVRLPLLLPLATTPQNRAVKPMVGKKGSPRNGADSE